MSTSHKLNVVVAVCNNMGIGIEGHLPWRLKQDMAFFKKITLETTDNNKKNMVIMGKKTWLSIPKKFRPLSDRINVVLSSQMVDAPEGALLVKSFDEAVKLANVDQDVENVFIIGGASVYKEAVNGNYPCRVYLTRIFNDIKCDTFFPELDLKLFHIITSPDNLPSGEFEEGGVRFSFEVYEKR